MAKPERIELIVYDDPDEQSGVHACTPYCPHCGDDLLAYGHANFSGAPISVDGYDLTKAEFDNDDENGAICVGCMREVGWVQWCWGETNACRNEVATDANGEYTDEEGAALDNDE